MMGKLPARLVLGLFLVLFFLSGGASAQTKIQGLTVSAESSERDMDTDTIVLNGHVQVIFNDQHLSCQHARVNLRSKTLDAVGQVVLISPQATVVGERILFDYEANTGLIFSGYVQSGPAIFEGDMISKSGDADYFVTNAKFTTCNNCPETWNFSGEKIRAQLGGYAFIKSSFLRIGGVPVFWLPYLIVPLKSDRQTGLLTPHIETSDRGGLALSDSLFWVLGRNQDATLTVTNYEKLGVKGLLNYRYVFSENSGGELDMGTLRDRAFPLETRVLDYRSPDAKGAIVNRWFTRYQHYLELPEGFVHRLQVNNASDLQYPRDFPLETLNHGDPAMENRMSLSKSVGGNFFMVDSSYYINLLQSDPLTSNNDAVHRLPEVRYSHVISPIGESNWLYSANIDSTNFVRSGFGYDDLVSNGTSKFIRASPNPDCNVPNWSTIPACVIDRDGSYDLSDGTNAHPGDLIRTGNRFDMEASILRPISLTSFLDVVPKLSYRQTEYRFNIPVDPTASRKLITAELDSRSLFSRVYGDLSSYRANRWKHEIQPEVTFKVIPWISQTNHPFFGSQDIPFFSQDNISDGDLNSPYGIQFDYGDRVFERKVVTMAVTNRVISKQWQGDTPTYRQDLYWRLSQSYDFYQAESNLANRQPWSDLESDLKLNLDQFSIYQQVMYYPYHQATNASSRIRYNFLSGDFLQLAHNYIYQIVPAQPLNPDTLTHNLTLSARATYRIFDLLGKVTYTKNPLTGDGSFTSYGYGLIIKLPGDCWHFRIVQYRPPAGDNAFDFSFDFNWDGSKKAQIPEEFLDSF